MALIGLTAASQLAQTGPATGAGAGRTAEVLSAYAPGAINDGLSGRLAAAAGPGNILTGTVARLLPGQGFTLETKAGAVLTLRAPADLAIAVGSSVTLRILNTAGAPQVAILAIDGRPVAAGAGPPQGPASLPTALPGPVPAAISGFQRAAISLEDEAVLEAALSDQTGLAAARNKASAETAPELAVGTLLRPAPARTGQAPLAQGTRYLVAAASEPDADPPDPLGGLDHASPASVATLARLGILDPDELPDFTLLSTLLTGRVAGVQATGEILVDTLLGVLALNLAQAAPVGTALRLRIVAAAPPKSDKTDQTAAKPTDRGPAKPGSLIDDLVAALGEADPILLDRLLGGLLLGTDETLLADAWRLLTSPAARETVRAAARAAAKALEAGGKAALAARLTEAGERLAEAPSQAEGWSLFTLPYLGLLSDRPVRLYLRPPHQPGEDRKERRSRGERVVVELALKRLGVMQFDGLVRTNRFDLVLRTEADLDPALRRAVDLAYRAALAECRYAGDLVFGRLTRLPIGPGAETIGLSA